MKVYTSLTTEPLFSTPRKLLVNLMTIYFINASQNLLRNLGKANNQFQDYLKNPSEQILFLKQAETGEVLKILKSLNIKKN